MRLRRETGDFQITVAVEFVQSVANYTFNTIVRGLGAEDLIGNVILVNYTESNVAKVAYSIVVEAEAYNSLNIKLTTSGNRAPGSIYYNPATGELSDEVFS